MSVAQTEFSVVELIAHASGGVQAILLILLVSSLVAWKLIFEYHNKIKKTENEFKIFNLELNGSKGKKGKPINAIYNSGKVRGVYGVYLVFLKSFKFLDESSELLNAKIKPKNGTDKFQYEMGLVELFDESFRAEMEKVEQGLKNKIALLGTISSTSPYVGLLGTVYGILIAFWGLGMEQQATIATVAPHIAEALIATGMGLFVAIPSLIAYNRLNHRVDVLLDEYEQVLKTTKILLKKNVINSLRKDKE